jgi:predicted aconitase with swiveling domain
MKMPLRIRCRGIVKTSGNGEALVSSDPISFYLVAPETGIVVEKGHCLEGVSIAGKVLIFPNGKGSSVVEIGGMHHLSKNGNLPQALIVERIDTVLVTAAVLLRVPLVDRVKKKDRERLQSGDHLIVNSHEDVILWTPDARGENRNTDVRRVIPIREGG